MDSAVLRHAYPTSGRMSSRTEIAGTWVCSPHLTSVNKGDAVAEAATTPLCARAHTHTPWGAKGKHTCSPTEKAEVCRSRRMRCPVGPDVSAMVA